MPLIGEIMQDMHDDVDLEARLAALIEELKPGGS
jgi:hypothetical protein